VGSFRGPHNTSLNGSSWGRIGGRGGAEYGPSCVSAVRQAWYGRDGGLWCQGAGPDGDLFAVRGDRHSSKVFWQHMTCSEQ